MRLPRLFARPAPPPLVAPPPPPLPPLPQHEQDELREAKQRVPAKWATFDQLLRDFAATDQQLRIAREPRQRA